MHVHVHVRVHVHVCAVWRLGLPHPGVLVANVGYFGVKSAKVYRVQMGTKPAKVGRLWPPVC